METEATDQRIKAILEKYSLTRSQEWWVGQGWEGTEKWRDLAKSDLFFLSTVVLGCSRFGAQPMGGALAGLNMSCHEEMCSTLTGTWEGKQRLMLIEPRDHFKSTIIRNYCIQRILQDPNVSILLLGATLKNQALRSITSIKRQFENNRVMRALFPEIRPQKGHWTGNSITVTRPYHGDESTIEVTAYGLQPEGGHYDVIAVDDIVTADNSNSRERQESVIAWASGIEPMLNEHGVIVGAGTRYTDYDWYGFLQREAPELWYFLTRSQLYDATGNMSTNIEDTILFPEEWTPQRIREKQISMGMQVWCCQYGNDPVPSGLAEIKGEWLEGAFTSPPEGIGLTNYGGFDPRGSGICEAASAIVSIDKDATIWVRDVQGGMWDVHESIAEFMNMLKKWQPNHSVFEAIGVGSALEQLIVEHMDETQSWYSVEFIKSWDRNLEDMVRTVVIPRLQAGKIKLSPHLKGSPLYDQLLRFPKAVRKDRLAAMTMAIFTAAQYGCTDIAYAEEIEKKAPEDLVKLREMGYDVSSNEDYEESRGGVRFAL